MSDAQRAAAGQSARANHVPAGFHTVTPAFTVAGGKAALAFYRQAFGAEVRAQYHDPAGKLMHAEIQIGDSRMMLSDPFPELGLVAPHPDGPGSASFMLYVPDVDAVYALAVAAGARPLTPVKDEFHGDRSGTVRDPFGHRWLLSTHIEDVPPEELQRRVDRWGEQNAGV